MTAYELMIKTNRYLIGGGALTEPQKANIVRRLAAARTSPEQANRFYRGVRLPDNADASGRHMYPIYFIPPYNGGKKYKTVLDQTPKTHIFSANMYELEILRLLWILSGGQSSAVQDMVGKTLARLKTTCFGFEDDGVGECFDTSLVVLRFLAAVASGETEWIHGRIDNYNRHAADKKRPWFSEWYYWLCLSELPFDTAKPEIDKYKSEMLNRLTNKSCVMNSERDKTIHPVLFCVLRNCLRRYGEYEYISDRLPFVNEKDGRLYFDMRE